MRIVKPVEATALDVTVVLAIARADAAVVNLHIQPLAAVNGCQHRADAFARGVLAMTAENRLEGYLWIILCTLVITVDSDPVHFAATTNFVFSHHRYVVFSLATYYAGAAACAGIQVYGYPPSVFFVGMFRPDA